MARSTISWDGRFAVIYPTLEFSKSKEAKDFLVALEPFSARAAADVRAVHPSLKSPSFTASRQEFDDTEKAQEHLRHPS